MIRKYAKIIDETSKRVEVGIGSNIEYYKSLGYSLMEVEQGADGLYYVKGYAQKTRIADWKQNRIDELKKELSKWDYIGTKIATGCATIEDYKDVIEMCEEYRKEIRVLKGEA